MVEEKKGGQIGPGPEKQALVLLGELLASGAIEVSGQEVTLRLAAGSSGVSGSFSCGCAKEDDPASSCRVVIDSDQNTLKCGGACLEGNCIFTVVIGPIQRQNLVFAANQ
jgi:hypothetical protein